MKKILILSLLCGCTPFIEGGVGYSLESGDYAEITNGEILPYNERGAVGHINVGVEFKKNHFIDECGLYHRSMVNKKPEWVYNDILCKKRWRFGE